MSTYDPHAPNADPTVPINSDTPLNGPVILLDDDPDWSGMYAGEKRRIREALGDRAMDVAHIGSTSVPGLCAGPCLDILLAVGGSADEAAYVFDLDAAGDVLRRREPDWQEHRVFKGTRINMNLHVWTAGDPIVEKHLDFRDWLRTHPDDRGRYAAEKRRLAAQRWSTMNDYANAKDDIVREIEQRIAKAGR